MFSAAVLYTLHVLCRVNFAFECVVRTRNGFRNVSRSNWMWTIQTEILIRHLASLSRTVVLLNLKPGRTCSGSWSDDVIFLRFAIADPFVILSSAPFRWGMAPPNPKHFTHGVRLRLHPLYTTRLESQQRNLHKNIDWPSFATQKGVVQKSRSLCSLVKFAVPGGPTEIAPPANLAALPITESSSTRTIPPL